MNRLPFPRLTRRRLLLALAVLAAAYAVVVIVLFSLNRNPARAQALALYDLLRPGMTPDEFDRVTSGEPIPLHVRKSISEPIEVPGGTHCIIWNHTERFELLAYFDANGLVRKQIMEEGWLNVPRYRRLADEYLGIPSPSVYKHWP